MFSRRTEEFEYLLYDREGVFKRSLSCVLGATVDYNSLTRLKTSATVTLTDFDDGIDFLNDQIQINVIIDGVKTGLGRFLISSPRRDIDGGEVTRVCDCYSRLLILDEDKTTLRKSVPAGTNVIAEVKRILQDYGGMNIPDNIAVTQTVREWEIGTPILTVVNDLLATVNYTSLRVDNNGAFVSEPYTLPTERVIELTYTDNDASIIYRQLSENIDIFGVPNVIIRYTNDPDINPPIVASYTNNSSDSPTSVVNRGRQIVDAEEVSDVADLQTLQDICKRDAYELTDKYQHVEFSTAINPLHDYLTCIYLKCYDIDSKMIETSWSVECQTGGEMKHVCRRVVAI
jgi:hypothetical protein